MQTNYRQLGQDLAQKFRDTYNVPTVAPLLTTNDMSTCMLTGRHLDEDEVRVAQADVGYAKHPPIYVYKQEYKPVIKKVRTMDLIRGLALPSHWFKGLVLGGQEVRQCRISTTSFPGQIIVGRGPFVHRLSELGDEDIRQLQQRVAEKISQEGFPEGYPRELKRLFAGLVPEAAIDDSASAASEAFDTASVETVELTEDWAPLRPMQQTLAQKLAQKFSLQKDEVVAFLQQARQEADEYCLRPPTTVSRQTVGRPAQKPEPEHTHCCRCRGPLLAEFPISVNDGIQGTDECGYTEFPHKLCYSCAKCLRGSATGIRNENYVSILARVDPEWFKETFA